MDRRRSNMSNIRPNLYLQTAPVQYLNKSGIIKESGYYIKEWGDRAIISGGIRALGAVEDVLIESLNEYNIVWEKYYFVGDCTDTNISKIKQKAEEFSANVIIGVGGGKAIDSAKAAAELCGLPIVTIPTIAATCAATTALSVIYNEKGEYDRDIYLKKNPALVLVEPKVIAEAPVKYLRAGIFDALSKWYEGKIAIKGINNPDIYTYSAIELARMLNQKMEEEAYTAVQCAVENKVEYSLINIIDLNIYLTGVIQSLGLGKCRGAAAHAIHNGLTVIPESHKLLHGIKVGYCIIIQLYIEELPEDEINKVISFFNKMGFEPSLKALNLPFNQSLIKRVAERASVDYLMNYMPFKVDSQAVMSAIEKLELKMSK
jgi:glycerol dehydrogenase-like iron-containing ADH family enzyme